MANTSSFYFQSYDEWRNALTVQCKINLTADYARERINALSNVDDPQTREFAAKYGTDYLQQVIQWFTRAEQGG